MIMHSVSMIDTHCHLTQVNSAIQQKILNAPASPTMIAVSTTLSDIQALLALYGKWVQQKTQKSVHLPDLYPAIGLHPWFLPNTEQELSLHLTQLENLMAAHEQVWIAVGEIGLDFSAKVEASKALQIQAFQSQLKLAQKFELPVSIHAVKSHAVLQPLLKQFAKVKGAVHGFYGSLELALSYVKLGFKIGVGPALLRPEPNKLIRVVQELPLENLLLETDFPNGLCEGVQQPADIVQVAARVARLKQISVFEVQSSCDHTAKELFKL